MTPSNRARYPRWTVIWVIATILGAMVGWFGASMVFGIPLVDAWGIGGEASLWEIIPSVILAGLIVGLAQAFALYGSPIPTRVWLICTSTGWFLGVLAGAVESFVLTFPLAAVIGVFVPTPGGMSGLGELVILGYGLLVSLGIAWILLGLIIGWAQARVLRNWIGKSTWWIRATVIGWIAASILGVAVLWVVGSLFAYSDQYMYVIFVFWPLGIGLFGLTYGLATGIPMQHLLDSTPVTVGTLLQWRPRRRFYAALGVLLVLALAFLVWQTGLSPCGWLDVPLKLLGCLAAFSGGDGPLRDVVYFPDGNTLAASSSGKTIWVWRVRDGSVLRTISTSAYLASPTALSHDGKILSAALSDNTVQLWQVPDGQSLRVIDAGSIIDAVTFSPDDAMLATGSENGQVQLWRVADGTLVRSMSGHRKRVERVAFSASGDLLASGSWDETVRLWRVSDGTTIQTLTGHRVGVDSLAYSPNGEILVASALDERGARVWRVSDGVLLRQLGNTDYAVELAFSPDETLLAATGSGKVSLWRVAGAELLYSYGPRDTFASAAFSPDGRIIALGGMNGGVQLWQVPPPTR